MDWAKKIAFWKKEKTIELAKEQVIEAILSYTLIYNINQDFDGTTTNDAKYKSINKEYLLQKDFILLVNFLERLNTAIKAEIHEDVPYYPLIGV